jgi:uncharacterized repeat protein (TIGR02543 family)
MKKISHQFLAILLTLVMLTGMAPLPTVAAGGDVTAKAITVNGIAGENKVGNLENEASISFNGSWPGPGWTAVSVGLIPAATALNPTAINSAFIGLDHDEPFSGSNPANLYIFGLDLTSHYLGTITPGNYRAAIYAMPPGGNWADEEIFYSADLIEVVAGTGFLYDISATTLAVTDGGNIGEATQLKLHLDFGLTFGESATLMPYDCIYLDFVNFTLMADPIDFCNAVLTSPAAFSFVDMGAPPGVPQAMVGIVPGAPYTVTPFGLDIIIDGAIPLEEMATVIVKMVREPDPPATFVSLGHWEGFITFGPGGDGDGLYSARAMFSQGPEGDILTTAQYHLYAYSKSALTAGDTGTATLHYTGADTNLYTINTTMTAAKSGDYAFYAKADWPDSLPSPVARVNSVDFSFDGSTVNYPVNKNAACSLAVTFAGDPVADIIKYLRVKDGNTAVKTYFLGNDLPAGGAAVTGLLVGQTYTVEAYGMQSGRSVVFGSDTLTANAGYNALELTLTPKSVTLITPVVDRSAVAAPIGTTGSGASIYWYDAPTGGKLLKTGNSYDIYDGETVYAEAVPTSLFSIYYRESERVLVQASKPDPVLALRPHLSFTVAGRVVSDGGEPIEGARVIVTYNTSFPGLGGSRDDYTDNDGKFSLQTPLNEGAILTVSHYMMADLTVRDVMNEDYGNLQLTTEKRRGLLFLPPSFSGAYVSAMTDISGAPVKFSYSKNNTLHLTDPDSVTGPLSLHLIKSNSTYADAEIALDADKWGFLNTISWEPRGYISYYWTNIVPRAAYVALLYDTDGVYMHSYEQVINSVATGISSPFPGYLEAGNYTVLFMRRSAHNAVSLAMDENNLETVKTALDSLGQAMYMEDSFSISDGDLTLNKSISLSSLNSLGNFINSEASGLTIDASAEIISARAMVSFANPEIKPDILSLRVCTNQISNSTSADPIILPGSVYINGKRAKTQDLTLYPSQSFVSSFNGEYRLEIRNTASYGGYPLTVQWQSKRTDPDRVSANAYVDYGGDMCFIGEADLKLPALTLKAPSAIGAQDFFVHGYAAKGSTVTISVNGITAATVTTSASTGFYNTAISLAKPIGPAEYSLSARAELGGNIVAATNEPVIVKYNTSLPALIKIETNRYGTYAPNVTYWNEGGAYEGSYQEPTLKYYWLTFRNTTSADDLERVTVHVPRSDKVLEFEAHYAGNGVWQTDACTGLSGYPTYGAWVSYTVAPRNIGLASHEYDNLQGLIASERGFSPEQQQLVSEKLAGTGMAVTEWTAEGKPATAMLTLDNGTVYQMSMNQVTSGAAATVASWPFMPTGAALDAEIAAGAFYQNPTVNTPYLRLGTTNGKFTCDRITLIPVQGGSSIQTREIYTMNGYEKVICDLAADTVTRTVYTRTNNLPGEPSGDGATDRMEQLINEWLPFFAAMADIAEPGFGRYVFEYEIRPGKPEPAMAPAAHEEDSAPLMPMASASFGFAAKSASEMLMAADPSSCTCGGSCRCGQSTAPPASPSGPMYNAGVLMCEWIISSIELNNAYGSPHTNLGWAVYDAKLYTRAKTLKGQMLFDILGYSVTSNLVSSLIPTQNISQYIAAQLGFAGLDQVNNSVITTSHKNEIYALAKEYYEIAVEHKNEFNPDGFPFNSSMPNPFYNCGCLEDDDEVGSGDNEEEIPSNPKPTVDPSGYVYEAVPSNRVPGVTATVWDVDPATGELSFWDAPGYGQDNPLITDEAGFYQWYVPTGAYAVTFSKPGYEDYTTADHPEDGSDVQLAGDQATHYMPVAPEQLDVNIALTSKAAPYVESVTRTAEGIYVLFSKYMDESTLTADNFLINTYKSGNASEQPLTPAIRLLDSEEGVGGLNYSRSILLEYTLPANTEQLDLTIGANVKSYAAITMPASAIFVDLPLVTLPQAQTPAADAAAGEVFVHTPVTLATATDGALIYYTTDGSEPSRNNGKLYTGAVMVVNTTTIKAVAVKSGMQDSEIMTATYSVTLRSEPEYPGDGSYPLTVSAGTGGTVSGAPSGNYEAGTEISITATANSNYSFTGWTAGGVTLTSNTANPAVFTMPANAVTITANFTSLGGDGTDGSSGTAYYTVSFDPDGGSAVPSQSVARNGKAVKPADPAKEGFSFAGWFTDKELTKEYDFNTAVTGNITIYAKWAKSDGNEWQNPFADLKPGDWFYGDVEYVFANGLFKGTSATTFSPNLPMTRAMLATVLWRMQGNPLPDGSALPFTDVAGGAYYTEAVMWAAENGIVKGIGGGLFAPDTEITRQDMAVMLMRYIEFIKYDYAVSEEYLVFADEDEISGYAKNAVQVLNKLGIINGKGNNIIDPKEKATRAEAAAMLHRFSEAIK